MTSGAGGRPPSVKPKGLGGALRKLAPHLRDFVREQPIQDSRTRWPHRPATEARGEPAQWYWFVPAPRTFAMRGNCGPSER